MLKYVGLQCSRIFLEKYERLKAIIHSSTFDRIYSAKLY